MLRSQRAEFYMYTGTFRCLKVTLTKESMRSRLDDGLPAWKSAKNYYLEEKEVRLPIIHPKLTTLRVQHGGTDEVKVSTRLNHKQVN